MGFRCHWGSFCAAAFLAGAAQASITQVIGPQSATHAGNLVVNGSFETGAPAPGLANLVYWASGTTNSPFAVPPGWTSSGQSASYAYWGSDGAGLGVNFSAPLPDGQAGLYFGNGITSVDQAPTYGANGVVTWGSPPVFTPGYGGPVTLSQVVHTELSPAASYLLNFWVSGEDAVNFPGWGEGVFGLRVTNVLAGDPIQYFAIPSDTSANPSRRFEFSFVPLNPLAPVLIEFINWGHINSPIPFVTELVLDDVIVNAVPEPASAVMFAAGLLLIGRRR